MGFELKTNTSYQNAIYRAKTRIFEPNRRMTEMEWRYELTSHQFKYDLDRLICSLGYHMHLSHPDPTTLGHWNTMTSVR
jgi:hypothetical protein